MSKMEAEISLVAGEMLGLAEGECLDIRVVSKGGAERVLGRFVARAAPPPVTETCDGRLPSRLEAAPVPPVVLEGAYLRYLRRMAGMKNEEIGRMIGATSSTVSNWENGVTRVPAEQWEQLVDLLTVT